jgi:hypothetical protein
MSFITTLSFADLLTLREVVRKVYMSNYEVRHVTDRECDKMIDALGERCLQKDLKRLIDRKGEAGVDGGFLLPDDVADIDEAETNRRKREREGTQRAKAGNIG